MLEALKKFWQSKTFGFLAILFLVATALLVFGRLLADQWIDLMKYIGAFATARGSTEVYAMTVETKKDEISKTLASATDDELARRALERTDKP
jgi:hypothetical protein